MIQHFGYSMKYNKLTRPDSAVENELMERGFHQWMREQKVLSGRVLTVDKDYDRKFHLVQDGVGNQIDQALGWLSETANGKYNPLRDLIMKRFDYVSRMRLLEALKAHHAVPIIEKHISLGRKVVLFHNFIDGGGFNPFSFDESWNSVVIVNNRDRDTQVKVRELHREFVAANSYVRDMDFKKLGSPIETISKAFPDVLVFNGKTPVKRKNEYIERFNLDKTKDASLIDRSADIIVIQSDAGQAGISAHDTTGAHQRVL